ncbi:hypothetical protein LIER_37207 [Lithospermum erythrorhizon]|uniref:Uncharacterized protein n=1 Tax=Lithospermum erythrorhizon TaxID=34254 RepID=A0AAV3PJ94_LITER
MPWEEGLMSLEEVHICMCGSHIKVRALTKWVEAKPLPNQDSEQVYQFLKEIFTRVTYYDELVNEQGLRLNLDLLEEKRVVAVDKMAKYKGEVAFYYNKNVRSKQFL